ncbi:MAG: DegV family protein [Oscillospiraceae bacterium]|nr:DegV family protein [Oscillospiraceae bacterium]
MSDFRIIANSTCDLPEELLKDLDLTILQLGINIGDEAFREIPVREFYQKIRDGAMPKTNAANVGEYTDVYESILSEGKDVLNLVFSSGLSTTYNSAVMAAEEIAEKYPDRKIYVVDTLAASMGEGLIVHHAAQMRLDGSSIEEVRDWVEENKLKVLHYFTINDLEYLKRGGRISEEEAVLGGMLGVKPVLHVDETGHLVRKEIVRGRQPALLKIAELLHENGDDIANQTLYLSHSDCEEEALWLVEQIKEKYGVKEVIINFIGPVIGSHTGVGVMAIFGLGKARTAE